MHMHAHTTEIYANNNNYDSFEPSTEHDYIRLSDKNRTKRVNFELIYMQYL